MSVQRQIGFWFLATGFLLLFLYVFHSILLPFVAGMAIAYLLDPVADRLERLGMSRLWATVTILVMSLFAFLAVLLLLLPILGQQINGLLGELPRLVQFLQGKFDALAKTSFGQAMSLGQAQLEGNVGELVKQGANWFGKLLQSVWSGGQALLSIVSLLVITPVVAFYLLWDWDGMIARMDSWLPRDHAPTIRRLATEMDEGVSGFVRGQVTVSGILGSFYAISLALVGLNFGILIGLTVGIISFIPYVGSLVGLLLAGGVAIAQFWPDSPGLILAVLAIFAVGQFFEGNILQPKLIGESVGLHPVWLMFALFAFGLLFGFVGLLIAVPAAASVGVLARFALQQYLVSNVYQGTGLGIEPVVDPEAATGTSRNDDESDGG